MTENFRQPDKSLDIPLSQKAGYVALAHDVVIHHVLVSPVMLDKLDIIRSQLIEDTETGASRWRRLLTWKNGRKNFLLGEVEAILDSIPRPDPE